MPAQLNEYLSDTVSYLIDRSTRLILFDDVVRSALTFRDIP